MKTILTLSVLLISLITFGQQLPRASTLANVSQTVGLNQITFDYSQPNVNGRTIFGELLKYGEIWRLGANECTKITLENPIFINRKKLDAGTYSMYASLERNQWTVVFNTDSEQWGTNDYDPAKNVLEYEAPVTIGGHTESLFIGLESIMESSANIVIRWANVAVAIPFSTDTDAAVMDNIQAAITKGEDLIRVYSSAADYFNDAGQVEKAREYLDQSLAIERTYYNVFLEAQITLRTDRAKANELGEEALKLANDADKAGWASYITRKIGEW